MAKIIVMANQKGGVGKSTLAILYANHLVQTGKSVLIIETDPQKTIFNQREQDIRTWGADDMKYNIDYFDLQTMERSEQMIKEAKSLDATVIIDVPGNITDDYIAPILAWSDYVICPYQYENKCLDSTGVFIQVIEKMRQRFPDIMGKQEIIYVPNNIDSRMGTEKELNYYKEVDEIFAQHGKVAPKVPYRAELRRCNTYINTIKQEEQASECFKYLDSLIYANII